MEATKYEALTDLWINGTFYIKNQIFEASEQEVSNFLALGYIKKQEEQKPAESNSNAQIETQGASENSKEDKTKQGSKK